MILIWQLIINAISAAGVIALMAVGFSLCYRVTRFFNFAHGAVFTLGAYAAWVGKIWIGLPLLAAFVVGMCFTTLVGCLLDWGVYRPLRQRGASPMIFLIASLGLYIVLQNAVSLFIGDDTKTLRGDTISEGFDLLGARITGIQVVIILVSLTLVAGTALLLKRTNLGKAMRAVANDRELAEASGIDSDRVILGTFALGSALAGAAGILVALDVDMTPTMGMNALMLGVVAVIIGGLNRLGGVALGALLLGLAMQLGVWQFSSQWQDAIAFIILLVFLLWRPQGFLGRKMKKATV